jgi:ankyrin repeat protein
MTSTKRRTLRFAIVSGLAVLVLACVAVNAFRSSQRNLHLMDAVDRDNEAQVYALLAQGANPNSYNAPVHLDWSDVDRLIRYGRGPDRHETTVLMQAAYSSNDRMLQALLKAGGDVHDETSYGRTPLICALGAHQHRNIEILIQYGADVNCSGEITTPLLEVSSRAPDPEGFRILLAHGADPNGHNRNRETPLMYAAGSGGLAILQALLRAGANLNLRNAHGETALRYAVDESNEAAVAILLRAGADITVRDEDGKTAEHIAAERGWKQGAQLIRKYRLQHPKR